jgi:membrane protease YdiL (CAAX protease family)
MAPFFKTGISESLALAADSAMTARLSRTRPWLRLIAFIPISILSVLMTMIALVFVSRLAPGLEERMAAMGERLDDTPFRLIEESIQTLVFAAGLGLISVSFLAAACVTLRAPLREFLWPGRRFDWKLFGAGALLMTAIQLLWIPFALATGGEWRPPVLDSYYPEHTRIVYAAAMAAGLLVAAAAEEVVFRGVLLRVSGLFTRRALVLCLVNGVMFSAIHLDPDPVSFLQRTLAGMGWTWAALRLGGLEFAIGSHFANNFLLALIWSPMSAAVQVQQAPWSVIVPELITSAIVVTTVELLARRRVGADPCPTAPGAA